MFRYVKEKYNHARTMSGQELVFLHFNDVYHISELGEKRDDIARFITHLEHCREQHASQQPYTVFSGDAFSPSLEASILRGSHMLPLLKELKIDVACYGNHDFDFGEARLRELAADTDFPWLLSNAVRENATGPPHEGLLAGARKFHTTVLQGYKVGFFGLAGTDWPSNCRELPSCTISPPVESARECARYLRTVEKCDVVVAITHMRLAEDAQVSEALKGTDDDARVDLILGGHDHDLCRRYAGEISAEGIDPKIVDCGVSAHQHFHRSGVMPEAKGDVRIIKSGTDWRNFSCIRLKVGRTAEGVAKVQSVAVAQISDFRKLSLDAHKVRANRKRIDECLSDVDSRISKLGAEPLLHTLVPMEGTGTVIRSRESNLCNMLADIVRAYYDVDIAFVNSGSVRCDKLVPATRDSEPGDPLTVRDLVEILPFNNEQVVKRISSTALLEALENSLSDAHTDGRFLQMSGLKIVADWARPEGKRILETWFHPSNGQPSKRERVSANGERKTFSVAMVGFIADGFDGYVGFKDQETLVSEEGGVTDTQLLLRVLGYGSGLTSPGAADDSEVDNARIARARQAIQITQSEDGLPIVAPKIEGRITFQRRTPLPAKIA